MFKILWLLSLVAVQALAQDAAPVVDLSPVPETIPSWLDYLSGNIPAETIAWMLGIIALLNGISEGLGKITNALSEFAKKTLTEADDKLVASLQKASFYLEKFLGFAKTVIDFLTAKKESK